MNDERPANHLSLSRRLLLLGGVAIVAAALLGLASARAWLVADDEPRPRSFPADTPLPDVELIDDAGTPTSLAELGGKPLLLFFGYTHCPDFCPLTLGTFAEVKRQLDAAADGAYFIFVSIDGERDTSDTLSNYVQRFDPGLVGLTGPEDTVRQLGAPLGLWFERQDSGGALNYTIDHTTDIYLIGAQGVPVRSYPFGTPADVLVADLRTELTLR